MHELAVCQALLDEVERIARARRAKRVAAVRVRVGALAGVEPELLQRAYEVARAGTLAEDASLAIEDSPVRVYCPRCGNEGTVQVPRLVCAACGEWRTEVVAGDDLTLMSVELVAADGVRAGGS
ncbi:MAG TPA: hydrogenase maturation nickel metallochaperone HypA [Steroidobacteraceae bacterium]